MGDISINSKSFVIVLKINIIYNDFLEIIRNASIHIDQSVFEF